MPILKPVLYLDNDCLINIFGRGDAFDEQRGVKILNCLKSHFNLRVTDTVFHTEIVRMDINPQTGRRWDPNVAIENWLRRSRTPIVSTSNPTCENKGEYSIMEAIERVSASLKKLGAEIFIASDDNFFKPDGKGGHYAHIRLKAADLIRQVEESWKKENHLPVHSPAHAFAA